MERINRVSDFQHLRHLWFGGAGTFVFCNLKTMRNFCVKFVPIKRWGRRTDESEVYTAFAQVTNDPQINPTYVKIGKYNFKTNDFAIVSLPFTNKDTADLLLMSF